MSKFNVVATVIGNVLIVAIYGALAYLFNKWWIILFSLLTGLKYSHKED